MTHFHVNGRLATRIGLLAIIVTTCPAQTPNWTQIKPSTSPLARAGHAMAYDAAHQRTVLFGGRCWSCGTTSNRLLADTWEWGGTNWVQIRPKTSPAARNSPTMAYDSTRQRIVLFGGGDTNNRAAFNDTWEYSAGNWTQIKPITSPPDRVFSVMSYDSARQRMVLFGGSGRNAYLGDTWEFDGKNWKQFKPISSPSLRRSPAMSYDPVRQRTVLFGGQPTGSTVIGDTWEWDGTTWTKITPSSSPSARDRPAMSYDTARQRTVLFGGRNSTPLADIWEWSGTTWTKITPAKSPTGRSYVGMSYDSVRQRTVLFGGLTSSTYVADTWEYGIPTMTLTADTPTISIANGGSQKFTLNAGTGLGNKSYWIFGSMTGTTPGVMLTGIHIPLRVDPYTDLVLGIGNSAVFTNFKGTLSATGLATASLNVPKKQPIPVGSKLYHAYVVYDGTTGQIFTSSNPVSVEFK